MNKKTIGIIAVVVVVLLAIVWFAVGKKSNVAPSSQAPVQSEQATSQEAAKPADKIINSIKDAIGLGTQMKCTYTSKNGDSSFESTVYVKGSQYKSVMAIGGKNMNAIFDGTTIYSWIDGQTTGTKFTMACMTDLKSSLPQEQKDSVNAPVKDPADSFNNAVDTKCVPSSEADFTVPTNVTFTDQCDMMKKSIEMMKNVKLPANMPKLPANVPGAPQL
jgi:hypothetical protein